MVFIAVFFFSSRRRHTRWPRDWSSDVCSSDLHHLVVAFADQNFWGGSGAIDQDQGGGVYRAAVGVMIGFFFFFYRLAHFTPVLFVLKRHATSQDFARQIRACAAPIAPRPRRPSPAAATATTKSASAANRSKVATAPKAHNRFRSTITSVPRCGRR